MVVGALATDLLTATPQHILIEDLRIIISTQLPRPHYMSIIQKKKKKNTKDLLQPEHAYLVPSPYLIFPFLHVKNTKYPHALLLKIDVGEGRQRERQYGMPHTPNVPHHNHNHKRHPSFLPRMHPSEHASYAPQRPISRFGPIYGRSVCICMWKNGPARQHVCIHVCMHVCMFVCLFMCL